MWAFRCEMVPFAQSTHDFFVANLFFEFGVFVHFWLGRFIARTELEFDAFCDGSCCFVKTRFLPLVSTKLRPLLSFGDNMVH